MRPSFVASASRPSQRTPDPRAALGRAAEEAAARHLCGLGWETIARNVRLCGAEIDLVMREDDTVVFVEVRSRSRRAHGGPLDTVGPAKQARVARAAAAFLARAGLGQRPARFDVVGVDWREGEPVLEHVRHAFESPF